MLNKPYWLYVPDFKETKNELTGNASPRDQLKSRYAYTWRGIRRPYDRQYDIAGGELIVLDRITEEILAVRRSFAFATLYKTGIGWEFSYFCPGILWGNKRVVDKLAYPRYFIWQVLEPIDLIHTIFPDSSTP